MRNVVQHFRAVPEELVPDALRSWTPLAPTPARTACVDAERATLRPRNACRMMIVVDVLAGVAS